MQKYGIFITFAPFFKTFFMKRISAIIIFVFCINVTFSQSLLWKVSGNGLQGESYLYGTIHIQNKEVFNFDTTVFTSLFSCDAFAMEVLMDEIDPKVLKNGMYMSKGKLISNMLTETEFKKLDSMCKKDLGTTAYMMNTVKPFFVMGAIQAASLSTQEEGEAPEQALDMFLLSTAREHQMLCYGVEEYQTQINAIDAISLKQQIRMLKETINGNEAADTTSESDSADQLLSTYLSFDLEKMLDLSNDESMPAKFNRIFLIDRNVGMADNFEKIAKEHTLFCAVGAAHLGGPKGVISLLRKKGYTVEPVLFKWK